VIVPVSRRRCGSRVPPSQPAVDARPQVMCAPEAARLAVP
jgi:hypothetical protein